MTSCAIGFVWLESFLLRRLCPFPDHQTRGQSSNGHVPRIAVLCARSLAMVSPTSRHHPSVTEGHLSILQTSPSFKIDCYSYYGGECECSQISGARGLAPHTPTHPGSELPSSMTRCSTRQCGRCPGDSTPYLESLAAATRATSVPHAAATPYAFAFPIYSRVQTNKQTSKFVI